MAPWPAPQGSRPRARTKSVSATAALRQRASRWTATRADITEVAASKRNAAASTAPARSVSNNATAITAAARSTGAAATSAAPTNNPVTQTATAHAMSGITEWCLLHATTAHQIDAPCVKIPQAAASRLPRYAMGSAARSATGAPVNVDPVVPVSSTWR